MEQLTNIRDRDVECFGSLLFHLLDRRVHDSRHLLIFRRLPKERSENTDPSALQPVRSEMVEVAWRDLVGAQGRNLVRRIEPYRGIEHDGEIGDAPGERPADVLGVRQRNDAVAARKPPRGAEPDEVVVRGRDSNRATRVAAHPHRGIARRDGRSGAATRPAGVPRRVVGIPSLTTQRADRRDAVGQLVHVGLAKDDGARLTQLSHLERIVWRD